MKPVEATCLIDDAASRFWDAIVIGAGPAGCAASIELARRGRTVLLVDRAVFPRYKVCGCCLNPQARRALAQLGAGDLLDRHRGSTLTHMQLRTRRRQSAMIRIPPAVGLSREILDAELIHAAVRAGASFLDAVNAKVIASEGDASSREVELHPLGEREREREAGRERIVIEARLVIAADGLTSPSTRSLCRESERDHVHPRSRLGGGCVVNADDALDSFCPPGRIVMSCVRHGYVGLAHIESGRIVCGACCDRDYLESFQGGWGDVCGAMLRDAGCPGDAVSRVAEARWRGTPPLTRSRSHIAGHRLLWVGDAAGYVEPFTGEGIGWAMHSALRAAPVISRHCETYDQHEFFRWAVAEWNAMQQRRRMCSALSRVVRSPLLMHAALTVLHIAPGASAPIVGYLNHMQSRARRGAPRPVGAAPAH